MVQQAKTSKCPLLIFVILIVFSFQTYSQTPSSFQYQAVLRDASGGILANQEVEIGIAILQGSITGTEVFSETHLVTTNSFGLANLQIGSVNTTGMEAINWGADPYFVQVSVDGIIMGTSQLLSVPYALYAKSVENDLVDDADADPVNELQDISLSGTEISISEGSSIDLSVLQDGIGTDNQKLRFTNNKYLEITNGNIIRLPFLYKEDDGDPENELQTLSKSGLEISLDQNGGTVRDSILTEAQVDAMVANNGYQLSANDQDTDPGNEIQTISKSGLLFTLNKSGGTVRDSILTEAQVDAMVANNGYQLSANDLDTDPSNEIQVLSISKDTIYLVNGGFVKLPAETDPIFYVWDRSTGVVISESQITDLDHFTGADITGNETAFDGWDKDESDDFTTSDETDPVYSGSSAFNITANDISNLSKLSGINTGDQDLSDYATNNSVASALNAKVDKETNKGLIPNGTNSGEMLYWNGSSWVSIDAPQNEGSILIFCSGKYTWTTSGKCPTAPVGVSTTEISNISCSSATVGGNLTSDGGVPVIERGICFSTGQNPTIADSRTSDGAGEGSFTSEITGLTSSTTYYVRAYATNSIETSYGEERSFTTSPLCVGDTYGGGIIAYFFQSGDPGYVEGEYHGIIAAPTDQHGGVQWWNGSHVVTGATGQSLGTGSSNTEKIINAQGDGSYAAKICADLVLNGYDDWFLPNINELHKLYLARDEVDMYKDPFRQAVFYWTSTEKNQWLSYYIVFDSGLYGSAADNGSVKSYDKNKSFFRVRAIRLF